MMGVAGAPAMQRIDEPLRHSLRLPPPDGR